MRFTSKVWYHNLETNGPSTILLDIWREKEDRGVYGKGINIRKLVYALRDKGDYWK